MFTPISEIKKLTIHELRDAIDEISNQIVHLERSQVELREFIASTDNEEDKVDFESAIIENTGVLIDKKKKVQVLRARLKLVDPAYYVEHYGDSEPEESSDEHGDASQVPVPISSLQLDAPQVPVVISTRENESQGMYL